jgi:tetratricopeptide (TPR) repeat protein
MAGGLLDGVLGGDRHEEDPESGESLARAEAFAGAIAAKLAGSDPELARDTSTFLKEQAHLLQVQARQLNEDHGPRLKHLRGQAEEIDLRRLGMRLRISFQIFIALAATVIGIGAVIMIRDAMTSHTVIVEAFDAPTSFATRGVTGTVLAASFLDELKRLQDATRSSVAAKANLSNAWSHEATVSVPEAGISLGELSKLLKARFGHDVRIGGNLIETESGDIALTVRGDGMLAKTFTGKPENLDRLVVAAAQYVYAEAQPVLWAIYLEGDGRFKDELDFIKTRYSSVPAADRPYLLNSWGNILAVTEGPTQRRSLELYEAALRLKPDYWVAYSNAIVSLAGHGQEEAAWKLGLQMQKAAGGRRGRANESYYGVFDSLLWNLQTELAAVLADADASGGYGTSDFAAGAVLAQIQAHLHDPAAAELAMETIRENDKDPSIGAGILFARGLLAVDAGEGAQAAAEMQKFLPLLSDPIVASGFPNGACWVARAYLAAGRLADAEAVLKGTGTFLDCYRFRGDLLAARGDWPAAQKAYQAAVALAPDLPAAYYSWGTALSRRGDFAEADAKLREANMRGPRWADPLKAWGDVLTQEGKYKLALAKYDEALRYAPNWVALQTARSLAAGKSH